MTEAIDSGITIPGTSAGELLIQARHELGMSIEDVAAELRLSPRQIMALEENDYDGLPGPTYVKGYLRNYARLVGVRVEDVLSAYGGAQEVQQPESTRVSPPVERQVHSSDRLIKFVTYLLVTILVALLVVWWQGREPATVSSLGSNNDTATATAYQDEISTPVVEPSGTETSPMDAPRTGEEVDGIAAEPVVSDDADAAEPKVSEDSSGPAQATPAEPKQERAAEDEPAASRAAPTERAVAPPADNSLVKLVLRYQDGCWTDIRDARHERLVYQTVAGGSTLVREGVPPFHVFFGNAQAVELEYDGKPYDISPHIRGVFARFTLGKSASEQ
jgi:cytoskeleton protein RodZ